MSLFPIFLKLTGRPCIVLGAGDIAESKIDSLRAAEARVIVIAPAASARIIELSSSGEIIWHQREYAQGDLAGHFLAVAATNNSAVNRAVFAEAEAAGILINAVDDPREILQRESANEARRELLHQLASRDLCGFEGCPTRALARRHAQINPLQTNPPPAAENDDSHSAMKSTIERKP